MKKTLISTLLLLSACGRSPQATGFRPGTYACHAESAYSVADDTLTVRRNLTVTRRVTFRRRGGSLQHTTFTYTGIWDGQKLQLAQNGVILVFSQNKLTVQNQIYRKL